VDLTRIISVTLWASSHIMTVSKDTIEDPAEQVRIAILWALRWATVSILSSHACHSDAFL